MARLAFTITNQALTFFVKGRPYSLTRDHENYAAARAHLQTEPGVDHDVDMLIDMVDVRRKLQRDSFGRIQFDGNEVIWQGKPLHNIWVERILEFREAGEHYGSLWNALDKLVHNPTQAAIERLPIFLDRVNLPFMPDGRFLAFKGVNSNYESCHVSPDGTRFRHLVGDKPRMPREEVDADPNRTCSTGLHVGAPGYVRNSYGGGSHALVLVAVDPVDVVAVPTDYQGEKMRVCGYEVIEHLDQSYSDELFGRLRSTYITPPAAPAPSGPTGGELAALACVGDTVSYTHQDQRDDFAETGDYVVEHVDLGSHDGLRNRVILPDGSSCYLYDDGITRVTRDGVEIRPVVDLEEDGIEPEEDEDEDDGNEPETDYDRLKVGDVIEYEDGYGTQTYGRVQVLNPVQVYDLEGELAEVDEERFFRVVPEDEITAAMVVTKGTLVRIQGHDFLQDGDYTIAGFNEEDDTSGTSYENQTDGDSQFWAVLVDGRRLPIRNHNIVVANHEGEHLWPRTSTVIEEADGSTTTVLVSLDGHDLRQDVNLADLMVGTTEITDEMVREVQVENVEVGQKVEVAPNAFPPAGIYPVVAVYHGRVQVQTEFDGIVFVNHDQIVRVVTDA